MLSLIEPPAHPAGGWYWGALAGLGAFHGLNPAMGWLFAVALGFQEGRPAGVWRALPPIALGHALSVAIVVAIAVWAEAVVAPSILRPVGAAVLIAFGVVRLWRRGRHPRWVGMRVSGADLVLWSFLMTSAHGAGLMLLPVFFSARPAGMPPNGVAPGVVTGLAALGVHSGAMLVVMGAVALVVYRTVGLALLRRAWVNVDLIWSVALIGAGTVTLLAGH